MKYIIDIEEKPLCVFDEDTQTYFPRLWRVKGFNSLVFDEEGLSRLEELNSDYINEHYGSLQDDAYQRGLDDAWEAARKIVLVPGDGGTGLQNLVAIFGTNTMELVFINNSASEAIAKLKAYKEKQKADDEIKVGDEVAFHHDDGRPDTVVVVTYIGKDGFIDGMDGRGTQYAHKNPTKWTKTGRHFDISKILEEMRK